MGGSSEVPEEQVSGSSSVAERHVANVNVAGSNPVSRSIYFPSSRSRTLT